MSSSPAEDAGDRPLDDDDDAVLLGPPGDAALLPRDRLRVVAVPMLADLDVRELPAGDATPPSTSRSSSPGRGPKLRLRRRGGAAEVSSIHRVALKESRNRTFLIASRRLPRIDDRFLLLGASSPSPSSSLDGRARASGTAMDVRPRARSRVLKRALLLPFFLVPVDASERSRDEQSVPSRRRVGWLVRADVAIWKAGGPCVLSRVYIAAGVDRSPACVGHCRTEATRFREAAGNVSASAKNNSRIRVHVGSGYVYASDQVDQSPQLQSSIYYINKGVL